MKRKRHAPFILLLFLLVPQFTLAEEDEKETPLGLSLNADVVSTFYWRGYDLTDDTPAIQPTLTLAYNPAGLWVNIWASQTVWDRDLTRDTDEVDLSFGWDSDFSEKVIITGGLQLYFYPRLEPAEDSSKEVFAGVSLPAILLTPTVTYYHDFGLGDGGYLEVGGEHSIDQLTLSARFGINNRQYTEKRGLADLVVGASYDLTFGSRAYLTPFVRVAYINDKERNPDSAEIWFGVSIGWER